MLSQKFTLREVLALVLAAIAVTSCAQNPGATTGASGSDTQALAAISSGTTSTSTSTGTSSSSSLSIEGFSPASGTTQSTMPTSIQVFFSESNLTSSVSNPSNWSISCTCGYFGSATSVSFAGMVATVSLPKPSCSTSGTTNSCTVYASSSIVDSNSNGISGSNSATYTLGSTSGSTTVSISSFSPVSGSSLANTVTVNFSSSNMSSSSVENTANWTLSCSDGATFALTSINYSAGQATVTIPSDALNLSNGTTCTLTALDTITDNYSDALVSSSATYTISVASLSAPTMVGTVGGNGGSPASNVTGPSGQRLVGFNVTIGTKFVTQVEPQWSDNVGNYEFQGQIGAGSDSTYGNYNVTCPIQYCYRAVGIYGNLTSGGCGSDGSQNCIQSIGLVCQIEPSSSYYYSGQSNYETYTEGNWVNTLGASYELTCPSGTFITVLTGRSGAGVDQLGIGCQ